jgi:hypothetical protein
MADGVVVSALLELKDKLSPGLNSVTRALSQMSSGVEHGQQSIQSMQGTVQDLKGTLLSMAASVGASFGAMELAKGFVEANAETERAHKQLAGFLASTYEFSEDPLANFNTGLRTATELMSALDDAEAEIGIDKSEMLPMAEALAPAFAQAGQEVGALGDFVSMVAGKASVLGLDLNTLSMNLTKAISEGRVGPGLKRLGLTVKEFKNAKTEVARLDLITKKLKLIPDGELRNIKTWDDLMRRIKITVDGIIEDGGKPFFEAAKKSADKMLTYLKDNRAMLQKVAEDAGDKLAVGMDKAVGTTTFLIKHFDTIWKTVKTIGIALIGWKASGLLSGIGAGIIARVANLGPAAVAFGASAASKFGWAAAGVAAAGIGAAIGNGLREYLETTEWWPKMWNRIGEGFSSSIVEATEQSRNFESAMAKYSASVEKAFASQGATTPEAQSAILQRLMRWEKATSKQRMIEGFGEDTLLRNYAMRKKLSLVATPATAEGKPRKQDVYDFRGSRFDITQKFAEGFDPDRIAVAFAQDLGRMGEMRVQSAMSPTAGLVR